MAVRVDDDEYNSKGQSFRKRLDKDYGKRGSSFFGDIGRGFAERSNAFSNFRGDLSKIFGDAFGYVTGQQGLGDRYRSETLKGLGTYSRAPKGRDEDPSFRENDRRASAEARRRNMNRMHEENAAEEQEQPAGFSFLDALKQAMGIVGGDDGGGIARVNYDPQRQEARNRASENDARLAAMYNQLQGSYRADAPGIAKAYDTAAAGVNQNAQQATGNINAAYDKARADQTAQLRELGIEEAAAGIIERGEGSGAAQANAVSNIEQNRGAVAQQTATNRQSALDYNKGIEGAAGLEGTLQRAQNQSALQQLLAQIDAEEQQQNAQIDAQNQSSRGSNLSASMGLAQALQEDYYRQHPELTPRESSWQEQQAMADFLYQQQQDASKAVTNRQGAQREQMNALMKLYGNDMGKAQEAYNWYVQQGLI